MNFHHQALPSRRVRHLFSLTLSVGILTAPLPAQSEVGNGSGSGSGGVFSIHFENDTFADTDRYYTNGVRLGWSSRDFRMYDEVGKPGLFEPVWGLLPFMHDQQYQKNLLLTLGQNMYTPDNKRAFAPVPGDHPYAGWLYMGLGLAWKNSNVRNTIMLNAGVVGPAALAEETQGFFHQFHSSKSKGWDNQLRNELGVVFSYDRTWRFPHVERRSGLGFEFLPNAGISVGNVLTAAILGAELRMGLNLPDDFGTRGISPVTATSTPITGDPQARRLFGIYAFARADGRAVAHNIFLDGNTFANSLSVDKELFVADLSIGVAMNYGNTKLSSALVYRTEEFETQIEPQVFGSIALNWAF